MHKKILIINSDLQALADMREALAKEGWEILTASDWEMASKLAINLNIDYVLMDARSERLSLTPHPSKE